MPEIRRRLERAKHGEGPTLFDWLVKIVGVNNGYVAIILE
jgi:hypothetical protein